MGLLDSSLNLVANYTYDSWGKMISVKDANGNAITDAKHIGNLNPFRYKGYYYDADTDLYYLQSRYYNPEWGRFLNADAILNNTIVEKNSYASSTIDFSGMALYFLDNQMMINLIKN